MWHSTLKTKVTRHGGLAQLARAPALQAGGHQFESDILHKITYMVFVAEWFRRQIVVLVYGGSNPFKHP